MTRKESNIEFYSEKECAGHLTQSLNQNSFFFKDLSICERERGREEESVQAGEGAEKEGERISSIF